MYEQYNGLAGSSVNASLAAIGVLDAFAAVPCCGGRMTRAATNAAPMAPAVDIVVAPAGLSVAPG